jgi:Bifunctional DNA primase/polymerase, N-terminal/Primase C terminal 1 (PriCT-1)
MMCDEKTTRREPTFWAAPDLAKVGYPVFPVGPDKNPSVVGGFYAATMDLSQIAEWITEGRENHDIAFATGLVSSVVVIDADTTEAYEKMCAKHGEPHARTKRGGHWYFRHPQDGKVTSAPLEPGLDCKADGGYVVAPPSRNRSWTNGIPDLKSLPRLPKELRDSRGLNAARGKHRNGSAPQAAGGEIPNGQRNRELTSLAGTMRRRGMGEAEILAALEVTNRLRCKSPLGDEEVLRIARSVAQYEPEHAPWWVKVVTKDA